MTLMYNIAMSLLVSPVLVFLVIAYINAKSKKVYLRILPTLLVTTSATLLTGLIIHLAMPAEELETEARALTEARFQLTQMYDIKNVNDLIDRNDDILSKLSDELRPLFDVSDPTVYRTRYGIFGNSPTELEIVGSVGFKDRAVIMFDVTSGGNPPVRRTVFVKLNEEGKFTQFSEYNSLEIIPKYNEVTE